MGIYFLRGLFSMGVVFQGDIFKGVFSAGIFFGGRGGVGVFSRSWGGVKHRSPL